MRIVRQSVAALAVGVLVCAVGAQTAGSDIPDRPDPKEIPIPPIKTSMPDMPGVERLPNRHEMPDVMTLNNGRKVKTLKQWDVRRAEMKRVLEYYAVGQAPPPPGNVKGVEVSSQMLMGGKVKYRLVHLTFGPSESLSLDIGIFTPATGGPFPALVSPSGTPPGATPLPHLAQGANQGRNEDVLLVIGPAAPGAPREGGPPPASAPGGPAGAPGANRPPMHAFGPRTAEQIAESNPALAHGFAFVTFNNNDCGEDTTLRLPDGSWAYRTTRFFPAYPNYDWGLLQAWAWGASRIVDYLVTDPSIDKSKLIITGVSRTGKAALIAGAFDDRWAMVAPVASSGGGTPAYRYSGSVPDRGGKEGLTEMVRKYPNWFSPNLHQFWGQPDKLPFDEHWFIALVAPRPLISLEGDHDQNVNLNGVYQSLLAARPAYEFFHASDKLGVSFADRPHGMVQGDWDALLAFADKFLLDKPVDRTFDQYPPGVGKQPVANSQ
ncbi:MAG: alpha/beta hydrolase family protein [Terracidiphilus sp.]